MSENSELNDDAWDDKDPNDAPLPKADADAGSDKTEGDDRGRGRRKREPDLEPTDDRQRQALDFLTTVVQEMEMECTVHLRRAREGNSVDEINLEIAGRDAGRIIGKKGQVLSALQFVTHRVINRPGLDRRHVSVDAEGYKSRRDDSLASMARRLGKQAVEQGKIITFEPMNPRDRRVVHLALAGFEGVITRSDGEGDDRRVQIIPVRRAGSAGSAPTPA
ncbi:MAG TPA: R3H domain-containing nucleic acid-binding protein [Polyangiaceae bacterium]|nr:R3H domain-containing nucleic acid-binding protein [Polyangiaceae bacterium]